MGCCHPEKKPEEYELLSFFHKMERENKFNFNIEKYEENYDIIINLSSNTFKKLKKKQHVRIGFVGEIIKNMHKIYTEEKEEKLTKKIVFYILILTLTLENYLEERKEAKISNNNDLQQFLLAIVIKILNKNFINYDNLKLVLYYLANMLVILFSEIKDINHYFNIENYISLVNKTIIQKNALKNNEIYPFLKVNLDCLGICFLTNYPEISLNNKIVKILIEFYVKAYFFNLNFLLENFSVFNKYLFLYNINNNTNKTIINNNYYNNKFAISDLIIKNNNFLSISNIKNLTNNDVSNYSINQSRIINNNMFKNSYISNLDEFSYNNNEFVDIIKTPEFKDIQKITFSLYSFLKTTIQDTLTGKKIFKQLGDRIDDETKKQNNLRVKNTLNLLNKRNSSNSIMPEMTFNNNIFKIISLFLFNKCKVENDKIIVLSFLEYISAQIKEAKHKEQYCDILLQIFFLFSNEQIRQTVINLLSKTFIKDIENHNDYDFIEELFGISHTNNFYLFGANMMKIVKHFLINMSAYYKEIQSTNLRVKILIKLSDVLNKYIKSYNKNSLESPSPDTYSSDNNNIKYKLKKEEILTLYENLELDNDNSSDNNYYYNLINYIKFFITFSNFLEYNFTFEEYFKELPIRKQFFNKLINYITKLEILSIQGEKSYVNDIIKLVKITLKLIEKNSIDCFEDFQILCILFGESLQKISNVSNNHKIIDFHFLKLIYSIVIFFLIQLKRIFKLPNSIIKIHKDILECIKTCDNDISLFLDEVNVELYSNSKLEKKIYQDFKNYLKIEKKMEIDPLIFRQIIDIIYSKLFGKSSSLFMFLQSQNCNIINEEIKNNESNEKNENNDNNEITEAIYSFHNNNTQSNYLNEIALKFADEKDSNLSIKKCEEESQRLNLPKISDENKETLFKELNKKDISSLDLSDKLKV